MKEQGTKFKLTISALEFYFMQTFDLLNNNAPIVIDTKLGEINTNAIEINEMSDFFRVIDMINKVRVTVATKMNLTSSRSHAALILTLH